MSRRRYWLSVAGMTALAGCSLLDPYSTFPHPAAAGAVDAGARVAICYDILSTSLAEVRKAAQQECSPHTLATPAGTDWYLQYCPLLLPARATFVCAPAK